MAFYLTETTTKNKQRERQTIYFIMPVEEKLKDAATNVKKKRRALFFVFEIKKQMLKVLDEQ